MPVKTKTERQVFSTMSDENKAVLVDEIVRWGLTIWNSNAEDLSGYWLEKKSSETICYLLRTEDGALVGCTTIKFYRLAYEGKNIVVVKLGLGVHPQHRGNKFALRCLMSELVRWRTMHPLTPLYLFSTLIHPVTYKLCCDVFHDQMYPYFTNPENPQARQMVEHLTKLFGVPKSENPSPFVYKERFSALETEDAIEYWRNSPRPEVRFFIEHCPEYYGSGDCLICLAPVKLMHTVALMVRTLGRNRLDKMRGRKHKFS